MDVVLRVVRPQDRETAGVLVWQRPEQHGINYAEDRGVRANAEGQCHYYDGGEANILQQHSDAVAKILKKSLHAFPLFVRQRHNRIDFASAVGGHESGQHCVQSTQIGCHLP